MKRLTKRQEKNIMKALKTRGEFLGHGSSRAVFRLGEDYCVKIAKDEYGVTQNKLEVDMFRKNGRMYLAEIKAYSKFFVVMEFIEVIDRDDVDYYLEQYFYYEQELEDGEDVEWQEDMPINIVSEMSEVVEAMASMVGETDDNTQLGFRENTDVVVCYDYGYEPSNHNNSVSDLHYSFENESKFLDLVLQKI